jgi:predicted nucleic acid-binding protein
VILVDTSIWIDHIRLGDPLMARLLEEALVSMHPCTLIELALGNLADRGRMLANFRDLPRPVVASEAELATLIEAERLFGRGIGYCDAHLLASARLTSVTTIWTRDRRLREAAESLGVAAPLP